jgi:hypothetical protein
MDETTSKEAVQWNCGPATVGGGDRYRSGEDPQVVTEQARVADTTTQKWNGSK